MLSLLRRLTVPAATRAGVSSSSAAAAAEAAAVRVRTFHAGVPSCHMIVDGHVGHGHSHAPNAAFVPKAPRDGGAHLGVGRSTAVIAIGSNQGDRVDLFRQTLKALKAAGIEGGRASVLIFKFSTSGIVGLDGKDE